MSHNERVLFINGQSPHVAELLGGLRPSGFDLNWIPANLAAEEQKREIANAAYLVLHPATLSAELLRAGSSLRLVQPLAAGYDKVDINTATELGIPVATNGGANAWENIQRVAAGEAPLSLAQGEPPPRDHAR